MTEKNIFVDELFLSLNISDFSLCKNCTSTEKIHPLLSQESPSKNWDAVKPSPPFENLVGRSTPQQKRRVGVHYEGWEKLLECLSETQKQLPGGVL